jgi:hypothetical protein
LTDLGLFKVAFDVFVLDVQSHDPVVVYLGIEHGKEPFGVAVFIIGSVMRGVVELPDLTLDGFNTLVALADGRCGELPLQEAMY